MGVSQLKALLNSPDLSSPLIIIVIITISGEHTTLSGQSYITYNVQAFWNVS